MRALFNCSCIKNVYLRTEGDFVELEIYNDDNSKSFMSRKNLRGLANPEYFIEKYEATYESIKQALLKNASFIEVVL